MSDPPTYRPKQAAEKLNISLRKLWLEIQSDRITARKAGWATLIEHSEIVRYVGALPMSKQAA